jgi:DNA-directed RNA polymerase subunit alpha
MKFYGRFELGPFAPGQGLTVANSLRRSLLSQLTGTAIPLVEISGASHEYETLTGVRESVLI